MLKKINSLKTLVLTSSIIVLSSTYANAKDFYYKFNNKDGKINFELTTNVHPLKANVEKFKGFINVKSKDQKNIDAVDGLLEIDTSSITTHISLCDSRMKSETLSTSKFPKITFKVLNAEIISNKLDIDNTVNLKLIGNLTIREVTKKVDIPVKVTVSSDKTSAIVEGKYKVNFPDYKVPDPSVLVAKVYPNVDLSFKLKVQ